MSLTHHLHQSGVGGKKGDTTASEGGVVRGPSGRGQEPHPTASDVSSKGRLADLLGLRPCRGSRLFWYTEFFHLLACTNFMNCVFA